jgi:protease I
MLFEAGRLAQSIQLQAVTLDLGTLGVPSFDVRAVATACRIDRKLDPAYMVCVGYPLVQQGMVEEGLATAKKVLMIVAAKSFEDAELVETKFVLEQAGFEVVIASSVTGPVEGLRSGRAESMLLLKEVKVADYDAVVFIGGVGAYEYLASPIAMEIARVTVESGKIVGAIGIAPRILANAGILPGVNVTCPVREQNWLKQAGAIYTGAPVERDGLIVTARDAMVAVGFGRTIADALGAGQ